MGAVEGAHSSVPAWGSSPSTRGGAPLDRGVARAGRRQMSAGGRVPECHREKHLNSTPSGPEGGQCWLCRAENPPHKSWLARACWARAVVETPLPRRCRSRAGVHWAVLVRRGGASVPSRCTLCPSPPPPRVSRSARCRPSARPSVPARGGGLGCAAAAHLSFRISPRHCLHARLIIKRFSIPHSPHA